MEWLRHLPRFENSVVLVAGDVGVSLMQVREALQLFKKKFDHVFYCYGNHETWTSALVQILSRSWMCCESFAKKKKSMLLPNCCRTSFSIRRCRERSSPQTPVRASGVAWQMPAWSRGELAQTLDKQNELWGIWPLPPELEENLQKPRGERKSWVLSFSHFLPELELMPEKRFLFTPNLTQIVGSNFIRERVKALQPDLHIFGSLN
eukprot:g18472.t1